MKDPKISHADLYLEFQYFIHLLGEQVKERPEPYLGFFLDFDTCKHLYRIESSRKDEENLGPYFTNKWMKKKDLYEALNIASAALMYVQRFS